MPNIEELQPFLIEPRENLAVEYKTWLDFTTNEHRAVLAKASIAMANHGGGYIIVGFDDQGHQLEPIPRPANVPEVSQDAVNAAIQRFAAPAFHAEVYSVPHPTSGVVHPVIVVPGNMTEPVMSKRDCPGVIAQNRCYIRKPGPRSEEPQTGDEWRELLRRCVLAGREDMLGAIRTIVSGRVEPADLPPDARAELHAFVEQARARWAELCADLPEDASARFFHGYYEMAFSLLGAAPVPNLGELQGRLQAAHRLKLTGWPTFLMLNTVEWAPYPHEDFVEAWVGRQAARERNFEDPAHSDFWRASKEGKLYTIRGYTEDSIVDRLVPGAVLDITLPVWRVAEGLLFAARFADTFQDVEAIAVECRFTGLGNRVLTSMNGKRAVFDDRTSHTPEIVLTGQVTLDQVRDNLTEFLHQLLTPLYERFDFFPLSNELVDTELGRLRGGQF
ncbi:helix-turn-helix domain-containing protein [Primorskyibacter flagellatus]|uniref:AlbA family DNA-binding domain-containing protein n=1 Tax=Primorskyibacter flagellatus TaxID=1387277 RepID=UPI003A937447